MRYCKTFCFQLPFSICNHQLKKYQIIYSNLSNLHPQAYFDLKGFFVSSLRPLVPSSLQKQPFKSPPTGLLQLKRIFRFVPSSLRLFVLFMVRYNAPDVALLTMTADTQYKILNPQSLIKNHKTTKP